jgi:hypothetical protein
MESMASKTFDYYNGILNRHERQKQMKNSRVTAMMVRPLILAAGVRLAEARRGARG